MNIHSDLDKIKKEQNENSACVDNINTELVNITNIINDIGNAWVGKDFDNFKLKMQDFIRDLDEIRKVLITYNFYLEGYVLASEELDSIYGNKKITLK